jgi:predicted PurR-regulated permease PerM
VIDDAGRQSSGQPDRHGAIEQVEAMDDAAAGDPSAAGSTDAAGSTSAADATNPASSTSPAGSTDPAAGPETATDALEAEGPIVLSEPDVAPISMTSPTAEAVTWAVRVASEWAGRLLIVALGGYILLRVLERISLVAFAFVLGIFFTSVLHPLERRLRAKLGKKSLSSAIVLLSGIIVFGLVGWFVYDQISSHSTELGDQINNVGVKVKDWLRGGPFHVRDADLDKWTTNLTGVLKTHQTQVLSSAIGTAQTVFEILGGTFLALISTFFLLRDGDLVWHWVLRLLPQAARRRVDVAGDRGWSTLGGYVRGQVTIAFIHAITIFFVLLILRVPLAAALAVIIFLGSFIPILGLTVSGALCIGVTLLEHGLTAGIVVAIAIIALVQIEGNLLQPLIMSRAVHIHPLAVALAVAAGTTLDGVVGALIAVPLAAFTNSFIRALRAEPVDPVTEDA